MFTENLFQTVSYKNSTICIQTMMNSSVMICVGVKNDVVSRIRHKTIHRLQKKLIACSADVTDAKLGGCPV